MKFWKIGSKLTAGIKPNSSTAKAVRAIFLAVRRESVLPAGKFRNRFSNND